MRESTRAQWARQLTPECRFPLIVKFLDASEPLSLQVHPPSGKRGPLGEGKSEAWYILDAEHESKLWIGLRPGTTREHLTQSAAKRDVLSHVLEWPARRGDIAFIPGGTAHAIGGGSHTTALNPSSEINARFTMDWASAFAANPPVGAAHALAIDCRVATRRAHDRARRNARRYEPHVTTIAWLRLKVPLAQNPSTASR